MVKVTGTIMSCTNAAQTVSLKFTLTGPLGPSLVPTPAPKCSQVLSSQYPLARQKPSRSHSLFQRERVPGSLQSPRQRLWVGQPLTALPRCLRCGEGRDVLSAHEEKEWIGGGNGQRSAYRQGNLDERRTRTATYPRFAFVQMPRVS